MLSAKYVVLTIESQFLRPDDAKRLLLLMVQSAAAVGSRKSYYCHPEAQGLQHLLHFHLIKPVPDLSDSFVVLPKGLSCLALVQEATFGGDLLKFNRLGLKIQINSPANISDVISTLNRLTRWELQLELPRRDWKDILSSKRKLEPVTLATLASKSNPREYFFDAQHSLSKEYLQCLLLLDRLFQGGLTQFHHFQLNSYYGLLIDGLQNNQQRLASVLPNQPAPFYKEMMTRTRKGKKRQQPPATVIESDDDGGDRRIVCLAKQEAPRARTRTRGRGRGRTARRAVIRRVSVVSERSNGSAKSDEQPSNQESQESELEQLWEMGYEETNTEPNANASGHEKMIAAPQSPVPAHSDSDFSTVLKNGLDVSNPLQPAQEPELGQEPADANQSLMPLNKDLKPSPSLPPPVAPVQKEAEPEQKQEVVDEDQDAPLPSSSSRKELRPAVAPLQNEKEPEPKQRVDDEDEDVPLPSSSSKPKDRA